MHFLSSYSLALASLTGGLPFSPTSIVKRPSRSSLLLEAFLLLDFLLGVLDTVVVCWVF